MAQTYEAKLAKFKATCRNTAGLETLNVKFYVSMGNAEQAALFARRAVRWAFYGYPELAE